MTDYGEQLELPLGWLDDSFEKYRKFYGRVVRCTVPVEFYSDDWHDGMRSRTYIGTVCSHHEGGVCLQPPMRAQGVSEDSGKCFLLTSDMILELLPGKIRDYG
jgi:hypothetical protein